jgi:6-phosphofructokinase 2
MQTILTLTMNPTIDTSTAANRVVAERKLRCKAPHHEPGGGGINVSRAIRKLGGESVAFYPAGGPTGQLLRSLLDQEGVSQQAVAIEGWTRESWNVVDESTHHQYRFLMPGPELTAAEGQRCLDQLAALSPAPTYLVASGSLPPGVPEDYYAQVARVARKLGSRFVLDTSGAPLRLALQEGVYLLKPNLRELCELSGEDLEDEAQQARVAQQLVNRGQSEVVVLSLGASGALLASSEGCERLHSPAVRARSRVGAGDSMLAGIVLSLARGKLLRAAVRFGIAAGAAAVLSPGTGLCRLKDTERLVERMV